MTVMNPESMRVLRNFIVGANAQYRAAGLGDYVMKLAKDGSVTQPRKPRPGFKQPTTTGATTGSEQAQAGAAPQASRAPSAAGAAPSSGASTAGASPQVSDLKKVGADGFQLTWKPVAGATKYGIWQDNRLIGFVPSPAYAGTLTPSAQGQVQISAVMAGEQHSALTTPLVVSRTAEGAIEFSVPQAAKQAAGAAAQAATAPEAAAS